MDTNKGDQVNPKHRCRLVAREIKKCKREDMYVYGDTAAGGEECVVLVVREYAGDVFGFH